MGILDALRRLIQQYPPEPWRGLVGKAGFLPSAFVPPDKMYVIKRDKTLPLPDDRKGLEYWVAIHPSALVQLHEHAASHRPVECPLPVLTDAELAAIVVWRGLKGG
jgi:hypothetical protein